MEDAGSRHSSGNDCDDYVANHGDVRGACNVFIMRGFLNVKDVNPQISVNFSKIQFNMLCKFKAKSLLLYDDSDDDAAVAADDGGDDDGVPTFMSVGRDYSIAQGKPVFATVFTKMGLVGYLNLYLYSIKSLL